MRFYLVAFRFLIEQITMINGFAYDRRLIGLGPHTAIASALLDVKLQKQSIRYRILCVRLGLEKSHGPVERRRFFH